MLSSVALHLEKRKRWLGHNGFAKQNENVEEKKRKEEVTVVPRIPLFTHNTLLPFLQKS